MNVEVESTGPHLQQLNTIYQKQAHVAIGLS
jgi:hypothetical protein